MRCVSGFAISLMIVSFELSAGSSPIDSLKLDPAKWKQIKQDREIQTVASLKTPNEKIEDQKQYSLWSVMATSASPKRAVHVLTQYDFYPKFIPYVDKSSFDQGTELLTIEGGIWGYRLASKIKLEQPRQDLIEFKVVSGHFSGLTGRVHLLKNDQATGTLIFLEAGLLAKGKWPPKIVVEKGAEIVFDLSARKMRNLMESSSDSLVGDQTGSQKGQNDGKFPRPQKGL